MMAECNGSFRSKHCQGTTFRRAEHYPLCQMVHEFQIESEGLGDHHGGSLRPVRAQIGISLLKRIRESSVLAYRLTVGLPLRPKPAGVSAELQESLEHNSAE